MSISDIEIPFVGEIRFVLGSVSDYTVVISLINFQLIPWYVKKLQIGGLNLYDIFILIYIITTVLFHATTDHYLYSLFRLCRLTLLIINYYIQVHSL